VRSLQIRKNWGNKSLAKAICPENEADEILGGVGRKMAVPITLKIPLQIAEGANRRRKLVPNA
jgi:hypothetical protein